MDPYVGEIRLFAGNYAPRDWAFCDGRELPVQQYSALFSVIGFQYGGNGSTIFNLPDLRGRVPMHQGAGPGLTARTIAQAGGQSAVTLAVNEMPVHDHAVNAVAQPAGKDPTQTVWSGSGGRTGKNAYSDTPSVPMNSLAVGVTGGSQPHNNAQPYVAINFIIALQGVFPSKP